MSQLRQRNVRHAGRYAAKDKRGGPPTRAKPSRSVHIAVSLLVMAVMLVVANRHGDPKAPWSLAKPLPKTYALCSSEKKIYTVPPAAGLGAVECVVVSDKRVKDAGSLAHVRREYGDRAAGLKARDGKKGIKVVNIPAGHSVTPGWIDSHAHPLDYGASRHLALVGSQSVSDVVQKVENFVQTKGVKDGEWVTGMGWDQNLWPVKEFPTAADLDTSVLKDLPIVLLRIDVHASWVSPAVLELIGDIPLEDVEGGQVIRDAEGRPTGVFIDNAIRAYITPIQPAWTDANREEYMNIVSRDALSLGMTGIHDAGLLPVDIAFFRRMAEAGKLPIRYYTMLLCENRTSYCGDEVQRAEGLGDGRWTLRSVKLFGDGALGSRGAALLDDYSDQAGWQGFLLNPEESWDPLVKRFYDAGWQVNVHAIGDRANHVVINAMERAIGADAEAGRARRLRIEHAQIMTLPDLERAARLGIIASYQPTHATSDMGYAEARLGPERIKGAYAWQSYLRAGGRITLGSDFPVESPSPLKGFYAAVARLDEAGNSPHGPGGWFPAEKLTREQALRGFTADPAYASFSEDTGSLTPGMRFDAVLFDDDLITNDQADILETQVKATFMDGQIVYGNVTLV